MSIAPLKSSTVTTVSHVPAYPFLSQPPPQKKRPTQPLPSPPAQVPSSPCKSPVGRRRSATTSAISAWVASVQPGSPAPLTPQSSPRRPSISPRSVSRRPSVGSARVPSASFLNIFDTPTTTSRITPSVKDFKHDLTAVGYTSVFVHFPNTPSSTAHTAFPRRPSVVASPVAAIPETPEKPPRRGLKRFRSLSALKSTRSSPKSTTMPPAASKQPVPPVPTVSAHMRAQSRDTVSKSKKSKYAKYRPPPFAAELALAQLADGGKMDDHIRRFAEAQARAGGAMMVDGKLVGVGDVWRDGEGGVWRDQDEEWEYAHLLGGDEDFCVGDADWVRFGSEAGSPQSPAEGEQRWDSVSSQDSDLDPRYAMQADVDTRDDLALFGSALMPTTMRKPGMSVLAIPTRNRRTAPHLRKPEFLLDVFPVPEDAQRSQSSRAAHVEQQTRQTGKERRRPAPITLPPPSPGAKRPTNPLDDVRKDFIDNSFAPAPAAHRQHQNQRPSEPPRSPARVDSRSMVARKLTLNGKSSIKMDVRGFLKVMGGKKDI